MLLILLIWLAVTWAAVLIAHPVMSRVPKDFFDTDLDRFMCGAWLGLLVLGAALLLVSIFTPLSTAFAGCLFLVLLFGLAVLRRPSMIMRDVIPRNSKIRVFFVVLLILSAAYDAAGQVTNYDTGLYHYQFTRWLAATGVVPNLTLIHGRLGFASSWFTVPALFDHGWLEGRTATLLGGLAALLVLVHLSSLIPRIGSADSRLSSVFLTLGYASVLPAAYWWSVQNSMSPDWPLWILVLLVAWLVLLAAERGYGCGLPLLFASLAMNVKASALPLVVVAFLIFIRSNRSLWERAKAVLTVAVAMSPMVLATMVVSGCLLFPASWACLEGPNKEVAARYRELVIGWARWGGPRPDGAADFEWLKTWITTPDKALLGVAVLASVVVVIAVPGLKRLPGGSPVLILGCSGIGFLFATAPNPRFGLGYFLILPALALAVLTLRYRHATSRGRRAIPGEHLSAAAGAVLVVFVLVAATARDIRTLTSPLRADSLAGAAERLVAPPRLPARDGDRFVLRNRRVFTQSVLNLETLRENGIEYRRPLNTDQCWAAPIPCTCEPIESGVRYRDGARGIRGGFWVHDQS